jgi:hypothetical protein
MKRLIIIVALVVSFLVLQGIVAFGMGAMLNVVLYFTGYIADEHSRFYQASFLTLCGYGYLMYFGITGVVGLFGQFVANVHARIEARQYKKAMEAFGGEEEFQKQLKILFEKHADELKDGKAIVVDLKAKDESIGDNSDNK